MKQTVIGLFNTSAQAQKAIEHLSDKGFDDDDIDFLDGSSYTSDNTTNVDDTNVTDTTSRNRDFNLDDRNEHESGVARFFKKLFGDNDEESTRRYSAAAARGNSIVTVYTDSDDDAQEAAHILDNNGAINADDSDDTQRDTNDIVATGNNTYNSNDNIDFRDRNRNDYTNRDIMGGTRKDDYTASNAVEDNDGMNSNLRNNTYNDRLANEMADNDADIRSGADATAYNTTTGNTNDNDVVNEDVNRRGERNNRNTEDDATGKSLPIIEETVEIGKRSVETGGVRLKSRIVEHPVEENLRLREERVFMNRNKVNRAATEADLATFKEGSIELVEHAEVPVVNKEARVVEEISLGKEVNERNETVRDTARKTEVEVEQLKGENRTDTDDNMNNNRRNN